MHKKYFAIIGIIFIITQIYAQKTTTSTQVDLLSGGFHRWSVHSGFLLQNFPIQELASYENKLWHAKQLKNWTSNDLGFGLALGGSYQYIFRNNLLFRLQAQLDVTGWVMGIIDIGFGYKLPITNKIFFTMDGSVSILQTGATLEYVGIIEDTISPTIDLYLAAFGIKSRVAFEFAVSKKAFLATFFSYTAYPLITSSISKSLYVNGFNRNINLDSLQIGIEFVRRF
ncbi:MAG: hypothetical protein ACRC5H_06690 [Treponemataceae bacterium]